MKDSKLHIVGLEALDDQCLQMATGDPNNPDYANKAYFFMYCYKVVMCPKRYSHDWGACPYAHNNESARRRDPQRFNYSSCICPNTGKGECPHGANCRYAHTLFEYWLHPGRFRTQMCKSGASCKRALCFFAHSSQELRQPTRSAATWAAGGSSSASLPGAEGGGVPLAPSFDDLTAAAAAAAACLPALRSNGCLDSSGSNVSASTCQQGSPTHLDCSYGVSDLGVMRHAGATLQLTGPSAVGSVAAATAGLLQRGASSPGLAVLPANDGHHAAMLPVSATGVVTSMPQLMDLLQQQQQQQLVVAAAAAVTSMPQVSAPAIDLTGLRPQQGALVANLLGQPALAAPSAAMLLQPVQQGGTVLTGLTACAPQMAPHMTFVQPVHQPAAPGLVYQQLQVQPGGVGGAAAQYLPWM